MPIMWKVSISDVKEMASNPPDKTFCVLEFERTRSATKTLTAPPSIWSTLS